MLKAIVAVTALTTGSASTAAAAAVKWPIVRATAPNQCVYLTGLERPPMRDIDHSLFCGRTTRQLLSERGGSDGFLSPTIERQSGERKEKKKQQKKTTNKQVPLFLWRRSYCVFLQCAGQSSLNVKLTGCARSPSSISRRCLWGKAASGGGGGGGGW